LVDVSEEDVKTAKPKIEGLFAQCIGAPTPEVIMKNIYDTEVGLVVEFEHPNNVELDAKAKEEFTYALQEISKFFEHQMSDAGKFMFF
jgi:L-fucose isomerase-like protein